MVECKISEKRGELKTLSFKHASGENISLLVKIWFNLAILLSIERMAISLLRCATHTGLYRRGRCWGASLCYPLQVRCISKRLMGEVQVRNWGYVVFYKDHFDILKNQEVWESQVSRNTKGISRLSPVL